MIATSIEQSKKLLELGIKPESADMHYVLQNREVATGYELGLLDYVTAKSYEGKCRIVSILPAWSLTVLWDLIPTHIITNKIHLRLRMDKGENDFGIWYDDFNGSGVYEDADFTCSNPIDAAVGMIKWLITNKYIEV